MKYTKYLLLGLMSISGLIFNNAYGNIQAFRHAFLKEIDLTKKCKKDWFNYKKESFVSSIDLMARQHEDKYELEKKYVNKMAEKATAFKSGEYEHDPIARKEHKAKFLKAKLWDKIHLMEKHSKQWEEHCRKFHDKAKELQEEHKEKLQELKDYIKDNLEQDRYEDEADEE